MSMMSQDQLKLLNHKLKGPLTNLNLYTESLLNTNSENLTDQQKDYLNEIAMASKKMVDNVNQLLKNDL